MRALFFQLEGTLGPPEGAMRAQKVGSEVASEVSGAHLPAIRSLEFPVAEPRPSQPS
jgi:hypothetical protein